MINRTLHIVFLAVIISTFTLHTLPAQFINLQLKIEPEISTSVEQPLNFGTQVTNSGRNEITLGDVNMGIFSVRAFYTQNVYLNLELPDALTHDNPAISSRIPIELNLSYNNSGTNDITRATPLTNNNGLVTVHESTETLTRNEIWQELYIYVYGYIDIGNIPNGEYTGDIILSVDYD